MGNAPPAPPPPLPPLAPGAASASPTAITVRCAPAEIDRLPPDVWSLVLARLRPADLAAAARVSASWRQRFLRHIQSRDLRGVGSSGSVVPLALEHHLAAVLGFAPPTGHLWCLTSADAPLPQTLVEYDISLRAVRTVALPRLSGADWVAGAVSADSDELLLLRRTFGGAYPTTILGALVPFD